MNLKKVSAIFGTAMLLMTVSANAQLKIAPGETVAFLGDSITQHGHNYPAGYVNLVQDALKVNGVEIKVIKAGISGNRSTHMLRRLEHDIIRKKPQVMTLSCGVNDVWHGKRGVKLEDYKKNIRSIVEQAQAAGIRVHILTATMISEDPNKPNNIKLKEYNDFLKELAAEKRCPLVDLNADMQKEIAALKTKYPKLKGYALTVDGVHMNPYGNIMMAKGILRSFGLNDAQIEKAKPGWMAKKWTINKIGTFTVKEFDTIQTKLWMQGKTVNSYILEKMQELLK